MNNSSLNKFSDSDINPNLRKHFYNLANLMRSVRFNYQEYRLLALSIIFIKRLIEVEYFKDSEIYSINKSIRNKVFHNFTAVRDSLVKLYSLVRSSNQLFDQVLSNINVELKVDSNIFAMDSIIRSLVNNYYDLNHYSELEFGNAFNLLIATTKDSKGAEYLTPSIVKKIMVELLDIDNSCSIYDPAVGIGGFFLETNNYLFNQGNDDFKLNFVGQEVNQQIYSLFVMNMFMNGIYEFDAFIGDTILDPKNVEMNSLIKYDRIISDPPFGLSSYRYEEFYRNDRYYRFQDIVPGKNSSAAFVQHILASLKQTGKAVILLNQAILYSGSDAQLRRKLVENDLIESIITLPSGILDFTIASPIILVFNKSKQLDKRDKVHMINFSKQFSLEEFQNLNFKSIFVELNNSNDSNITSYTTTSRQIVDNNYILDPERYSTESLKIQELEKQSKAVKLEGIAQIIRGTQTNVDLTHNYKTIKPLVTIKDLNREITSKYIEIEKLRFDNINGKEISERCILIALVGNDLKPTIYDPGRSSNGPEPIIIGNNVVAIIPDENLIRLDYLYYQFYSTEVQKQISSLRKGVIPNFSMSQLREIIVPLPSIGNIEISLREQDIFIEQQTRNLFELEELRFKEKVKELDISKVAIEIESTTIRTLAHNILPIVTTSSMALIRLKKYLTENNLMDNIILESNSLNVDPDIEQHLSSLESSQSVKQIIESLESNLEHTQNVISKTRDIITQSIKDEDIETYDFKEFMEDFIDQKKVEFQNLFEIKLQCPPDIRVKLSKTHFIDVLNNLLWNAKVHAFDNFEMHTKKLVEFNIEQLEALDQIIFTYKNNGRKLEISEQEYFQALKKSNNSKGFGLGGFFIKSIIQQLNGKVSLVKRERGFEMKIILPIPKSRSENAK